MDFEEPMNTDAIDDDVHVDEVAQGSDDEEEAVPDQETLCVNEKMEDEESAGELELDEEKQPGLPDPKGT